MLLLILVSLMINYGWCASILDSVGTSMKEMRVEMMTNCAELDVCPEDVIEPVHQLPNRGNGHGSSASNSGCGSSSDSSDDNDNTCEPNYPCINGTSASIYSCDNVDMYAHLTISELGGASSVFVNDIWGWTDTSTGKEYALVGLWDGTALVDVSNPNEPFVQAFIDTLDPTCIIRRCQWRDIKTYEDYVYIVQDAVPNAVTVADHGLQWVHLPTLIQLSTDFYKDNDNETAIYHFEIDNEYNNQDNSLVNICHNAFVNEESGYLYLLGCDEARGGAIIYDLNDDPNNPTFVASFAQDNYTHDIQCVMYDGKDKDYKDREICFGYQGINVITGTDDHLLIFDVTDKNNIQIISDFFYDQSGYCHQGWIDEKQKYLYLNDEADELIWTFNGLIDAPWVNIIKNLTGTRTFVFNIEDLDNPYFVGLYESDTHASIDHNHFVLDDLLIQAHYRAGLRILDIEDPADINEVGFFDTYVEDDGPSFNGMWGVYPYFDSGIIIASDIEKGLFIFRYNEDDDDSSDSGSSDSSRGSGRGKGRGSSSDSDDSSD